jgi:hypothetical protein
VETLAATRWWTTAVRPAPRAGVYLLRDRQGKVIYVGKAKSLRGRVRSYFRGGDERSQVPFLVRRVASFETLVTTNDKEALILENNLIKQYKPRYNIRLKDDKSYVSVKVTVADPWPRVLVTRKIVKDGSRYFGPFASAYAVRETLDTIRKVIPLRTCSDGVFRNRSRPCLEYQIKRCLAPCCLAVDREAYQGHLREAMLLLEGKRTLLIDQLRERMRGAAEALRFEEAARIRDRLKAIERTQEPQQAVSHWGVDQDIFGFYREGGFIEDRCCVRQGKLTGNHAYRLDDSISRRGGRRCAPDAVLPGRALRAGRDHRPGRPRGPDRPRRVSQRTQGTQRCPDPATTRRPGAAAADGDGQRQPGLPCAPGCGASIRNNERGSARAAASAQCTQAYRVLRHIELPGEHGRGLDGQLRRRRA